MADSDSDVKRLDVSKPFLTQNIRKLLKETMIKLNFSMLLDVFRALKS